jgi:hypothetical protein
LKKRQTLQTNGNPGINTTQDDPKDFILSGWRQACYTLPVTGRNGPTSGYYLNNMEFLTGFHRKKLNWKEIKEMEIRKEV